MRRYDLQVHTDASPCSRAAPTEVVDAAVSADLDGIAITNHDTLEGYEAVRSHAPEELTVIPGVEVTTTQGHLLALDVHDVPPQGDPIFVIDHVHQQNGMAILSHPFDRLREHYTNDLDEIGACVDGVEIRNSRCLLPRYNRRARQFATDNGLPVTGGSDAHFPMEVGRATTVCKRPVFEALSDGGTGVRGRSGYVSGHIATKINDALSWVNA